MSTYTKTTWVNDTTPAMNATNLNHIETGIYDAHTEIAACLPLTGGTLTGTTTISHALGGSNYTLLGFTVSDGVNYALRETSTGNYLEVYDASNSRVVLRAKSSNVGGGFGGFEFTLGDNDQSTRGNSGSSRALAKTSGAVLTINYAGDFTGGTNVASTSFTHEGYNVARFRSGNGKNIWVQPDQPTSGMQAGDIWIDTSS